MLFGQYCYFKISFVGQIYNHVMKAEWLEYD